MFALWDGWGRLFSRQVQYSQCNGFLHEESLCAASWRSSGRAGGTLGQRPELGLALGITSQARQVLRVGLASPLRLATSRGQLGKWRVQTRSGLSVQTSRPRGLLFPSFGLYTFTGNPVTLSCPANLMLLSLETSPCLSVLGSLGTRRVPWHKGSSIAQRPPCSPMSHGPLGPWPRCWLGGEWEEDTAPEGQRVLSRAFQPSSSGWEPPGPPINISSVGGILQPSLSQSRV